MTMFDTSRLNNSILAGLTKAAQHFVTKMHEKRVAQRLPEAISSATSIGVAHATGNGSASIEITIDLDKAPMAAAFEWGSGLMSMRKPPEKYKIEPKNASMLAFEWGEARNIRPEGLRISKKTGKVILPYVMHPGIKPRQYIAPTLLAEMDEIKRIVGAEVKASVVHAGKVVIKV